MCICVCVYDVIYIAILKTLKHATPCINLKNIKLSVRPNEKRAQRLDGMVHPCSSSTWEVAARKIQSSRLALAT